MGPGGGRVSLERLVVGSPFEFSLVVAAHRGGPMLEACLDSVANLDPRPGEIVVALDGSDVAVHHAARARGFRVVANPAKPGVAASRNSGARSTSGAYILFADSDVVLRSDHVARAVRAFAEHPEVGAILGSYDDQPAARGLVSRYRNLLHHYTHQHAAREARTFWAGCGAVRRAAFLAVGGFDSSYGSPSVEDIDLGYRLRRAGYRIRLVPEWQVTHLKRWRLRDLILTDIGRRAIPWTKLLRREGRLDNDLNLARAARASAGLVSLAAGVAVGGWWWRPAWMLGVLALAAATGLNWRFYGFLARRGGWGFAGASIPLHWLYFLGATVGFVVGALAPRLPQVAARKPAALANSHASSAAQRPTRRRRDGVWPRWRISRTGRKAWNVTSSRILPERRPRRRRA
jgi:GT2 family glycosyltransferase